MSMRTMRWMLCMLLACCASAAHAQSQVRAWLDRDRIAMGETATLNIETDQADAQAPDFDVLIPDFVVSGHGSRRGYEMSGGQRRVRVSYTVVLSPRREGVATIPALRIGNAATSPLTLTVVPAFAAPARAGAPSFIESEVDSRDTYVQQSVGYVLRLYYATPLVSGQLDQPTPDGASMQKIGSDLQYTRDVAGRRYTVVERRYQIVPERSGTLLIPGARFSGRGVGGYFDDLFGSGQRDLRANGSPLSLVVKPMPDGAPQPWLPLHGLELRYIEAPQSVRAGEAATVVVEAVADGAVGTQLPELALQVGGAQVFAEPPQVDETFDNGRLRSRVVRRFSVVPAHEGALRVPGVRLAWWDVNAGIARTASVPDLQWQVAEGAGASADMVPVAGAGMVAGDGRRVPTAMWMWLALAFALLWLVTLAWAVRRQRIPLTARRLAVANADEGATPVARLSSRELMRVLQTGDLGEIEDALLALASPAAPDLEALARQLGDESQRVAIGRLQRARWAGGEAASARASLTAAFAQGPRWRVATSPSDAARPLLSPLYPERPEP